MFLLRCFVAVSIIVLLFGTIGYASAFKNIHEGDRLPPLTLQSLENGELTPAKLSAGSSRSVRVILFWATWSDRSVEELKFFDKLGRDYKGRLEVIAINAESQELTTSIIEKVKRLVAREGISVPVYFDPGLVTYGRFGVIAVPSVAVAAPDGTIEAMMANFNPELKVRLQASIRSAIGLRGPEKAVMAEAPRQYDPKAQIYFNLGRRLLDKKQYTEALKSIEKALAIEPDYPEALLLAVKICWQEGKRSSAEAYMKQAAAASGDRRELQLEIAEFYVQQEAFSEALPILKKLVEQSSNDPKVITSYAVTLYETGDEEAAEEWFHRAIALDPLQSLPYYYMGRHYEREKRWQEATAAFERAASLALGINLKEQSVPAAPESEKTDGGETASPAE